MIIETVFAQVGAWIVKNYGKTITDKAIAKGIKNWEKFNWKKAAEVYKQNLLQQHSQIRILGMAKPVDLEGIFTDVYLLERLTAHRRFDIEILKKEGISNKEYNNLERMNGMDILSQKKGQRLFILGKPGAGKTTFLKYIIVKASQGEIAKVPIYISLKEWSTSGETELLSFMVKQFELCNFPDAESFIESLLNSSHAIIMLDGLDEVNQENNQRAQIITQLNGFFKKYNKCQYLMTCRIAANEYIFEQFQDIEVADFNKEQIVFFVKKWFSDSKQKYEAFLKDFNSVENKSLQELASTPLLLTLLCLTYEVNMSFPKQRAEIYYDALDVLLRRWDSSRSIKRDDIYRNLTPKRKQHMFAHIAAVNFEKGKYFFRQEYLEKSIDNYLNNLIQDDEKLESRQILKSIEAQHSIFIERAKGIYSFSHLSFQEYFTAKYITDNESRALKSLIFNHLTDDRWREVFLLTASLLDESNEFFELMKKAVDKILSNDEDFIELLN